MHLATYNEDQINELKEFFIKADKDGSGTLDREEFIDMIEDHLDGGKNEAKAIFTLCGGSKHHPISMKTFIDSLLFLASDPPQDQVMIYVFHRLDDDNSGYISFKEFKRFYKNFLGGTTEEARADFDALGGSDGKITLQEFLKN